MPPVYYFYDADDGPVDVSDRFRAYVLDVTTNAEQGSVAQSTVRADDPDADIIFVGHRRFKIVEDTAPAGEQTIGQFYVAARRVSRGDYYRTGPARVWDIDLTDINTVIGRRVMVGNDCNRPAETDIQRLTWLLGTNEISPIGDDTYVETSGAVNMDAVDYRGQMLSQVLDDCSQQSGKNFFVWYKEDTNDYSLFYDFSGSTAFSSDVRLSNVISDIESDYDGLTYYIDLDAELQRDPSRVFSGVYLPYDGGWVYASRPSTAEAFAYRDTVMPAENVKTKAKATARANRYLTSVATEEDVISCSFLVPLAEVNKLIAGQRLQFKATHMPGYESFTWVRCLNKKVFAESEDLYRISVELVGPTPESGAAATGRLWRTAGYGGRVYFEAPGDTPPPGWPPVPTSAGLTPVSDPSPTFPNQPYVGWDVTGTGTLDVMLRASIAGVLIDNIPYTVTLAITLNGSVVGSTSQVFTGFLQYIGPMLEPVVVTGLSVAPGDQIRATLTCSPPTMPFFRTPAGTGQDGEGFYITGGSLA